MTGQTEALIFLGDGQVRELRRKISFEDLVKLGDWVCAFALSAMFYEWSLFASIFLNSLNQYRNVYMTLPSSPVLSALLCSV